MAEKRCNLDVPTQGVPTRAEFDALVANGASQGENFTSVDVADGGATIWTSVAKLNSGEKHSSIFAKMSQMFKNIRYLYKIMGETDIGAIGDGTVRGAISTLNASVTSIASTISSHTAAITALNKIKFESKIIQFNNSNTGTVTLDNTVRNAGDIVAINGDFYACSDKSILGIAVSGQTVTVKLTAAHNGPVRVNFCYLSS